jgi:hypothetical protein
MKSKNAGSMRMRNAQYLRAQPDGCSAFTASSNSLKRIGSGSKNRRGSNLNARRELDVKEGKPMPWTAEDAERHTKKADNDKRQRMWAEIANSVLAETGDEGRAIREANAMVGRDHESTPTRGKER